MRNKLGEHGIQFFMFFSDSSELNLKWPLWVFCYFVSHTHIEQQTCSIWTISVSIGGQSMAVDWILLCSVRYNLIFFGRVIKIMRSRCEYTYINYYNNCYKSADSSAITSMPLLLNQNWWIDGSSQTKANSYETEEKTHYDYI